MNNISELLLLTKENIIYWKENTYTVLYPMSRNLPEYTYGKLIIKENKWFINDDYCDDVPIELLNAIKDNICEQNNKQHEINKNIIQDNINAILQESGTDVKATELDINVK